MLFYLLLVLLSNRPQSIIDWPAVFVIIGVSASWAEVWLRNRREEREAMRVDEHLKWIDERVDRIQGQVDHHDRRLGDLDREVSKRGIPMPPQGDP